MRNLSTIILLWTGAYFVPDNGTRTNVFEHFNATFKKGSVSAIVGESGSGKTTPAALMQNLYPLLEGRIRIGGVDIKHIDNADLRSLVCVVPQKIDLFGGTILENIVPDDYEPDIKKVLNTCQDVGKLFNLAACYIFLLKRKPP